MGGHPWIVVERWLAVALGEKRSRVNASASLLNCLCATGLTPKVYIYSGLYAYDFTMLFDPKAAASGWTMA
jgi:hypothetical protein